MALAFVKEGADIVVHYNNSAVGTEETANEIHALGRKAITVKGNIAEYSDVQAITEAAFSEFSHIDVLVNNVGDMALNQKS